MRRSAMQRRQWCYHYVTLNTKPPLLHPTQRSLFFASHNSQGLQHSSLPQKGDIIIKNAIMLLYFWWTTTKKLKNDGWRLNTYGVNASYVTPPIRQMIISYSYVWGPCRYIISLLCWFPLSCYSWMLTPLVESNRGRWLPCVGRRAWQNSTGFLLFEIGLKIENNQNLEKIDCG